jgi:hypothetical protein
MRGPLYRSGGRGRRIDGPMFGPRPERRRGMRKRGTSRGVAVLASAAVLIGMFALGPADAARKAFTKKKALNLFYDKSGADARFEEEADVHWARVDSNGGQIGGDGVTATSRDNPGGYLVSFDRSVAGCAILVTAHEQGRQVGVMTGPSPNTVEVSIRDLSDSLNDSEFSISLLC